MFSVVAFAGNGDGTGGSNGAGIPDLLASSVATGSTNVPLDVAFSLEFAKNVSNDKNGNGIIENNKSKFQLINNSNGKTVSIRVSFAKPLDDTYKNYIFVKPVNNLKPNTNYTLKIATGIMANNGNTSPNSFDITFTTGSGNGASNTTYNAAMSNNGFTTYTVRGTDTNDIEATTAVIATTEKTTEKVTEKVTSPLVANHETTKTETTKTETTKEETTNETVSTGEVLTTAEEVTEEETVATESTAEGTSTEIDNGIYVAIFVGVIPMLVFGIPAIRNKFKVI